MDSIVRMWPQVKLWLGLFWCLTIDHNDFQGFDHWLHWISTIYCWLRAHLQKYMEECVQLHPFLSIRVDHAQSQQWLLSLWEWHSPAIKTGKFYTSKILPRISLETSASRMLRLPCHLCCHFQKQEILFHTSIASDEGTYLQSYYCNW